MRFAGGLEDDDVLLCQRPAAQAGRRPAHPGRPLAFINRLDDGNQWFKRCQQPGAQAYRRPAHPGLSMALSPVMLLQPSAQSLRGNDEPNLLAGVG